jgi:outer membrane protein assembly factor BamA
MFKQQLNLTDRGTGYLLSLEGIRSALLLILFLAIFFPVNVQADNSTAPGISRDVKVVDEKRLTRIVLPFAFYSETFKFAIGVAGGSTGYQDGQAGLYGAALTTTNSTSAFYFLGSDIRMPFTRRLFLDPMFSVGWYSESRDYISANPDFPDERAGSNDSDPDNFITDAGWDNWLELRFKYILPMGHGRDKAINTYMLNRGILVSGATGGEIWNPLKSGRTFIQIKPFYRYRSFDFEDKEAAGNTNGIELGIVHDNRDFPQNPSKGGVQRLYIAGDFGWFDSFSSWSVIKGSVSKYYSLGKTEKFRQRVLALNIWTADTPSAEIKEDNGENEVSHRAPAYYGATLGGYNRLRAFPMYRFHDVAAIYYGAEYRLIPDWNPLGRVSLLDILDIDWMQFVGFFEAGRVAEKWTTEMLYEDLHWDAGFGIRLMSRKVVVRLDTAFSNEGWTMWAMAGHPF